MRQQKVIKMLANVFGVGIHHVSPKGIITGSVGVKVPEAVGKWHSLQQFPKTFLEVCGDSCHLVVLLFKDLHMCSQFSATL
jgi:hypothetical protein